jgi:hypothetical protein
MTPYEFIRTQRGGRLYFLWNREKNPQKKEAYQEMFNEELKKINGEMEEPEDLNK